MQEWLRHYRMELPKGLLHPLAPTRLRTIAKLHQPKSSSPGPDGLGFDTLDVSAELLGGLMLGAINQFGECNCVPECTMGVEEGEVKDPPQGELLTPSNLRTAMNDTNFYGIGKTPSYCFPNGKAVYLPRQARRIQVGQCWRRKMVDVALQQVQPAYMHLIWNR